MRPEDSRTPSGRLISSVAALATFTLTIEPYLMTGLLAVVLAAATLIYARLIGRLGWVITNAERDRAFGGSDSRAQISRTK